MLGLVSSTDLLLSPCVSLFTGLAACHDVVLVVDAMYTSPPPLSSPFSVRVCPCLHGI